MSNLNDLSGIQRGCIEIITEDDLQKKFNLAKKEGRPLRVKMGFDPTAPDLHLGHCIGLNKLRDFQELGAEVQFLIGDFTAKIGDPSGRNKTRPSLSEDEIKLNAATYQEQVFKVLDAKKTKILFNSTWCEKLGASDMIRLAAEMNVARMLEREDFKKRYLEGISISIHEFLYPLVQGYDSVAMKTDIEIGGQDQRFNLLVGRELQKAYGQDPQVVILLPLIEGIDGQKKMSKSYGNAIGITESPESMFTKIMSMPDTLMPSYFENLTRISKTTYEATIKSDPRKAKMQLAAELITQFHSAASADEERSRYNKKASRDVTELEAPDLFLPLTSDELFFRYAAQSCKPPLFSSAGEARRMVAQGGVSLFAEDSSHKIDLETKLSDLQEGLILKIGKKKWFRVRKA